MHRETLRMGLPRDGGRFIGIAHNTRVCGWLRIREGRGLKRLILALAALVYGLMILEAN